MIKHKVTIWNSVPILMELLLEYLIKSKEDHRQLASLRLLLLSGDWIPVQLPNQLRNIFPQTQVVSLGGATEASIWSVIYEVGKVGSNWLSIPYGKAMANQQLYVLDRYLRQCPVRVEGEIYIGGLSLAQGYLNDSIKTAASFIHHPGSGERLYKTGDIGRIMLSGNVELIGREDTQVKINGYRIELGEIEGALNGIVGVKQSVVIAKQAAGKYLCAYLSLSQSARRPPDVDMIKGELARLVPDYMIPSKIIILAQLPLTQNGKVDRKQLFSFSENASSVIAYAKPRNDVERRLVTIWKELLHVQHVGIDDNFFNLGGDSVLVIQLISEAAQSGYILDFQDLFKYPTIRKLADYMHSNKRLAQEAEAYSSSQVVNIVDRGHVSVSQHNISDADIIETLDVLPAQAGILSSSLLGDDKISYVINQQITIHGRLEHKLLKLAWGELFSRIFALQVGFLWRDLAKPLQFRGKDTCVPWVYYDWSKVSKDKANELLNLLSMRNKAKGFNLDCPPLIRLYCIKIKSDVYQLICNYHHIIMDGWSIALLIKKLFHCYMKLVNRVSSLDLEPDFPSYRQHVAIVNAGNDLSLRSYWHSKKSIVEDSVRLTMHEGSSKRSDGQLQNKILKFSCVQDVTTALENLAKDNNLTINNVIYGVWSLLLRKVTGNSNICFFTTISNRSFNNLLTDATKVAEIIGMFVGLVPIAIQADGDMGIIGFLHKIQLEIALLQQNTNLPLAEILDLIDYNHIEKPFDTIVSFQDFPKSDLPAIAPRLCAEYEADAQIREFPLMLVCEKKDVIEFRFVFDNDRLSFEKVERLAKSFDAILTQIVTNPQRKIAELSLVSHAEKRDIISLGSGSMRTIPPMRIHGIFEEQVVKTPNKTAVIHKNISFSYDYLNVCANKMARYLKESGVVANDYLAISLKHGYQLITAMLATLKLGAIMVPLDSKLPPQRLMTQLDLINAKWLIVENDGFDELENISTNVQIIKIDELWSAMTHMQSSNLGIEDISREIAYVVYTSGSTAQPRPVLGTYNGIINRLRWMWGKFPYAEDDVCCQHISIGFLDSFCEIFSPLLCGVKLVIVDNYRDIGLRGFLHKLAQHQVSRITVVPTILQEALNIVESEPGLLQYLRLITTSGEPLPALLAIRFAGIFPDVRLLNLYGSSETSADVTCYEIKHTAQTMNIVPIGRPIDNTACFIMDIDGQVMPVGFCGELCVVGPALAAGYFNDHKQTAIKFVNCRIDNNATRVFKTGDIAVMRNDGTFDYLGRKDNQLTIRGHRIEIAEIEASMIEALGVNKIAVVLKEDGSDKQIVLFYVPNSKLKLAEVAIRNKISSELPHHMIPERIIPVKVLPVLPSGKLDRNSYLFKKIDSHGIKYQAPKTALEKIMANVWRDIFRRQTIGVNDNFFSLGGTSLTAIALSDRLRLLGIKIMPAQIYTAPTIVEFVKKIKSQQLGVVNSLVPMAINDNKPLLFFIHPIGGGVHWYSEISNLLRSDYSCFAIASQQLFDNGANYSSLEEMGKEYLGMINSLTNNSNVLIVGWSFGAVIAYEILRQIHKISGRSNRSAAIIMIDPPPFNISSINISDIFMRFVSEMLSVFRVKLNAKANKVVDCEALHKFLLENLEGDGSVYLQELPSVMQLKKTWQIFLNHSKLLNKYEPETKIDMAKIICCDASRQQSDVNSYDWGRYVKRPQVDIAHVSHYGVLCSPYVATLAKIIKKWLQNQDLLGERKK